MIVRAGVWDRIRAVKRVNPFAFWLFVAVAAGFLVLGQAAHSYELNWTGPGAVDGKVCAQIRNTAMTGEAAWKNTVEEARAAYEAYRDAGGAPVYDYQVPAPIRNTNTTSFGSCTHAVGVITYNKLTPPTGTGTVTGSCYNSRIAPDAAVSCPPPVPVCGDGTKGRLQPMRAATAAAATTAIGGCNNGCAVKNVRIDPIGINPQGVGPAATFYFLPYVEYTGEVCAPVVPPAIPSPDPEPTEKPDGEICKTTTGGTEVCTAVDSYGENCGYLNGKHVCLGKTDPDECWINDDGSRWCGEKAPTPPVPDNGTRGVKAAPVDSVAAASGGSTNTTTYNYYSTGQVAASATPPTDDGANPNRTTSTNPSTSTSPVAEQGDGEGGEGGEFGDAFSGPPLDPVCTFQECTQTFLNAIRGGQLATAVSAQTFAIAGAACPAPQIAGFGGNWTIDFHCWLFGEYSGLFSALFLFGWTITAARVFLSA